MSFSLSLSCIGGGNGNPLRCSCLENPRDGGAWWAAVYGVAQSRTRLTQLHFHFSLSRNGEGNGNPLRCSCLENPRDGGAWWAAVYGVAQSRTRLTRLSSSSRVCVWRVFYAATASVNSKCNTEKKSSVIPMNDGVGQTWPSRRMCILLKIERRKSG